MAALLARLGPLALKLAPAIGKAVGIGALSSAAGVGVEKLLGGCRRRTRGRGRRRVFASPGLSRGGGRRRRVFKSPGLSRGGGRRRRRRR